MVLDLLSWFVRQSTPSPVDDEELDARASELATRARSDTVTDAVLANTLERTAECLLTYIEDDEQPEFVLRGSTLLVSDEDDSLTKKHPSRELQVVISARRLLFVIGGRIADHMLEVPLEDIVEVYVDAETHRRFLIVEADREGDVMTFFADVTLTADPADVRTGVEFVRTHRDRPAVDADSGSDSDSNPDSDSDSDAGSL